jgi:hypothetical protein
LIRVVRRSGTDVRVPNAADGLPFAAARMRTTKKSMPFFVVGMLALFVGRTFFVVGTLFFVVRTLLPKSRGPRSDAMSDGPPDGGRPASPIARFRA